jgi:23S rRNA pseudouridine2605 synthase
LLATNDGDFSFTLLHPKQKVPKTYVLKVTGEMKEADMEKWRTGIELDDGMTRPADLKLIRYENGKTWLELTITEGRNQMIRRMGEKTGFYVMRLARTSFAGISSEDLPPGKWRVLTREELLTLKKNYGVPKTIHAQTPTEEIAPTGRSDRFAKSTHGAFGGGGRSHRTAPQPDREMRGRKGRARAEEARERGPNTHARRDGTESRGPNTHARRDGTESRGPNTHARRGSPERAANPRERAPSGKERAPHARDKSPNFRDRSASKKSAPKTSDTKTPQPKTPHAKAPPTKHAPSARSAQWKTDEAPREPYGMGRGGRTRTTGTSGGVGSSDEGDYRMKRTRRGTR